MRPLPAALRASLATGVTTLARCWVLTRRDGVTLGFTEHDRDLIVDGVTCRAATGIAGTEVVARLGFAADAHEVHGALSDDTLAEMDLAAGRWDDAAVTLWLVDWSNPAVCVRLRAGSIGEVTRAGAAFIAEVRGLSHRLDETRGRLYAAGCDADLGDARCGIDLAAASWRASGSIVAIVGATRIVVAGLDAFDTDWFTQGRLAFTSGANAGSAVEVKAHRRDDGATSLSLWQRLPEPIAIGDAFTITAGCDKDFATCRDRFANAANFRGCPHMPGNDFVLRYAVSGETGNDGTSLSE